MSLPIILASGTQSISQIHPLFEQTAPGDPGFLQGRVNAYYRNRVEGDWRGGHIMKGRTPGGSDLVLTSNDYLSLSTHAEIVEAQVAALRENGRGVLRSDVFRNGEDELGKFETGLAALMGAEDVVTCQSGWNANVGLLQSMANEETPVYLDMYAHTSLWEGVLSAGATARPFKHNDPESLDRMAAKHGAGVVCVDAVYSTSGEIAPLRAMTEVAERHGCVLVVDESHSLGIFGARGEGLVEDLGLSGQVHFRTSSLSKAFAARGGIVAGSARNMEYFRYESRPAIFSSGILPSEAAGFLATLEVIAREDWRRARLQDNAAYLRAGLDALGYNVEASRTQIISLVAGPEENTILLRDALETARCVRVGVLRPGHLQEPLPGAVFGARGTVRRAVGQAAGGVRGHPARGGHGRLGIHPQTEIPLRAHGTAAQRIGSV